MREHWFVTKRQPNGLSIFLSSIMPEQWVADPFQAEHFNNYQQARTALEKISQRGYYQVVSFYVKP